MHKIKENNIRYLINRLDSDDSLFAKSALNNAIFNNELYVLLNDFDIVTLVLEEKRGSFLIPVFNDFHSLKVALNDISSDDVDIDVATGKELISFYFDDDDFYGLALNPPHSDYILKCRDFITL